MLKPKELLQRVELLIKSGKYKKINGRLSDGTCGRCYLGLAAQVLVDEGYYEWRSDVEHEIFLVPTAKGLEEGLNEHHMQSNLPKATNIPRDIFYNGKIVPIYDLNDEIHETKVKDFAEIHEIVSQCILGTKENNSPAENV
jgi:hypothetical protein